MFLPFIVILAAVGVATFIGCLALACDQQEITGVVACAGWGITALVLGGLLIGPKPVDKPLFKSPPVCECKDVAVCRD